MNKLMEVAKINRQADVFIFNEKDLPVDFTGFSCDDINDVSLYITGGDKEV